MLATPILVGEVYQGVNEFADESRVPASAESRGVAHLLMGAGVVLVKKFYGTRPTPPRLRATMSLRDFFWMRASTPPLLRRGLVVSAENNVPMEIGLGTTQMRSAAPFISYSLSGGHH